MRADESHENSVTLIAWLFPLTYLIHIAEEFLGGEGFSAYLARVRGVSMSPTKFLVINGVGWGLMLCGIVVSRRLGFLMFVLACYATIVIINGLSHTVNTMINSSYNPGVVSGLVIWIPLGILTLFRVWKRMDRKRYWQGIALGVGIHAVVTITALSGGRLPQP